MSTDVLDVTTGEHLKAFNEIAKALTSTLKPGEVLQLIMQQVTRVIRPSNWSLLLEDERTGELVFEIAIGEGAETLKGLRIPAGEGIVGAAFTTCEAQIVTDVSDCPNHASRFDQITRTNTKNIIALPLRIRGRALGVLEIVNGIDERLRREDLQLLKAVADYAAIAIENARNFRRVEELTITDEHTGLFNSRHLRALLQSEVLRASRFNHHLSLLFLDLDRFKSINDSHGHLLGSELLKEVGTLLTSCIRQVDSVFRYGGDEFAAVLVETDDRGALQVGERIRGRFNRQLFLERHGLREQLTASIGVATYPDNALNARDLLEAADRAMYRAKALGRNRVVSITDPEELETREEEPAE